MIGGVLNLDQLFKAINETIYMTVISLTLATILGLLIGILLYCTQTGGLFQNKLINRVIDVIINVLRAIPFIILLIILFWNNPPVCVQYSRIPISNPRTVASTSDTAVM